MVSSGAAYRLDASALPRSVRHRPFRIRDQFVRRQAFRKQPAGCHPRTWVITLLISIAGGAVWTLIVRRRKTERPEYATLYYWLLVVVRYRSGIGIIGFGFTETAAGADAISLAGFAEQQFWRSDGAKSVLAIRRDRSLVSGVRRGSGSIGGNFPYSSGVRPRWARSYYSARWEISSM